MKALILLLTLVFVAYACSDEAGYKSDNAQNTVQPKSKLKKKKLKKNRNSSDSDEDTNASDDDDKKKKKHDDDDDDDGLIFGDDDDDEDETPVVVDDPPVVVDNGITNLELDPNDPTVAIFRIKAGTGNGSWNLKAATAAIDQSKNQVVTLRIINDDNMPHRLHTGGEPCNHQPNNTAPGDSFDCALKANGAINPDNENNPATYDHNDGNGAEFWIKFTPKP